jgi:hypothetical protein
MRRFLPNIASVSWAIVKTILIYLLVYRSWRPP